MYSQDHGNSTKTFIKKLYCPQHGSKFVFKCGYEHCQKPFVCNAPSCIEDHFHHQNEGKLVLFKFDSTDYVTKFQQLERVLNKQDYSGEAKILKSFIDELKFSMVTIYKDYRELHLRKQSLSNELSRPFDSSVMTKVQQTINIGLNLRKQIDLVKSKINLKNNQSNGHLILKDKQSPKSDNQSVKSSKMNMIELQSQGSRKIHVKNGQRQYEQGQVIMEKGQKNISQHNPVPIDLQEYNSKNQISKPLSPIREEKTSNEVQQKYVSPFQKSQNKDSFDKLFENGSKTFSSEKVQNLRNLFQNSTPDKSQIHQNGKPSLSQNSDVNLKPQLPKISKQNLKIYERDFLMKKQLTIFLEKRIKNLSWGLCEQIHSSLMPFKSIQKFHESLEGRRNLLFIFIGEDRILGSFYPSRYPRLAQKTRNDPKSFLFISNGKDSLQSQIIEFKAVQNEFHLSVSERLYICHGNQPSYADGIRTIQRNFNELNYCLPSVSYKYASDQDEKNQKQGNLQTEKKGISGFLKVKEFFVLQVSVSEFDQENVYQID